VGIHLALVRLVFGALCAGLSMLTVVEAPTSLLWFVALGVTEWGYWLVAPSLLVWWPGWNQSWLGVAGAVLGSVAAVLFATPLVRAVALTSSWPDTLPPFIREARPRVAPGASSRSSPLVFPDLLFGVSSPDVARQEVVFAANGNQPLALDLYRPTGVTRAPVVVTVHGGSWQHGDRGELSGLNRYLAARGYVVAAVSYRFAPQWPFPAARDDVHDAVAFLKTHAADYGLDPRRIVLLGRSAGGQIALSLAYAGLDPDIRGVVSFYAPADMIYGYERPSNPRVLDSIAVLEAYLGGNPSQTPATYEAASPIQFASSSTVPTLLIHGGRDELVFPAQSERLAARLVQLQRPHYFLRLPWATHGCDVHFSGLCGQISTYVTERFLASVTR
jgi:acetyl esterase/lipase